MVNTPVIQITNLTKIFGDVKAVDGISLTVNKGDIYGVLGANGAGKTTTISTILGLIEANEGEVEVLGEKVGPNNNQVLKRVGALIGDGPAFFPYMSGRENLQYVARRFNISEQRIDEVLEFIGLTGAANKKPSLYSTGMKQRLGIAMAIIHNPEILILDEPTNGMDPAGMKDIRNLIKKLSAQGTTIVLCSHLLHEVEQVCNKVAIFNKGKIIKEGTLEEIKSNSSAVVLETEYINETITLLESKGAKVTLNSENKTLEVLKVDSKELIIFLVKNSLPPTQVFTKGNNLEELYLNLIESEKIS